MGILTSAVSVPLALGLADVGGWRFVFIVAGLVLAAGFLSNLLWFPRDSRERVRNWSFFSRYSALVRLPFFPDGGGDRDVTAHSLLDDGQLLSDLLEGFL